MRQWPSRRSIIAPLMLMLPGTPTAREAAPLFQLLSVYEELSVFENLELALAGDRRVRAALFSRLNGVQLDRIHKRLKAEALCIGQNRVADLVLETRIGVDDVPACHKVRFSRGLRRGSGSI